MPDFNIYFRNHASYPFYGDAVWYLTQMRRWGQIAEHKADDWYHEMAKKVYRPDIYGKAAEQLIKEGKMKAEDLPTTDGYHPPQTDFIDGIAFDAKKPNDYLSKLTIGLKQNDSVK